MLSQFPDFPNSPLTNVVYCPDPLSMTDEEIEREIPRSRWLAEMTELAQVTFAAKECLSGAASTPATQVIAARRLASEEVRRVTRHEHQPTARQPIHEGNAS